MKRLIIFVLALGLVVSIFCTGASAYATGKTFFETSEWEISMDEAIECIARNVNPSSEIALSEGVDFTYIYDGIEEWGGMEWYSITFGEDSPDKFTALRHFIVSGSGKILELDINTNEYVTPIFCQGDIMEPNEGAIYIENNTLTIVMNLPSMESTSTWTYYSDGDPALVETEYGEPRQMGYAQDAYTWSFEAVEPGVALLNFEYHYEAPDEQQRGFLFTFLVDETLNIINIAGMPGLIYDIDEYNDMILTFSIIIDEVYESEVVTIEKSPYLYELLGEDVSIYSITCANFRTCMLAMTSDGEVYINENEDTPNFLHIIVGNITTIGEPVNDYSHVDYDALAEYVANDLIAEKVDVSRIDDAIVDHMNVRVYAVSHAQQVDGYLAIDDTTENMYYDDGAIGSYCELLYEGDHYVIGESVTLTEGM